MRLALSILLLLGMSGSVHAQSITWNDLSDNQKAEILEARAKKIEAKNESEKPNWGSLKAIDYSNVGDPYQRFARDKTAIDARNPYAYYSSDVIAAERLSKAKARLGAAERARKHTSPSSQKPKSR